MQSHLQHLSPKILAKAADRGNDRLKKYRDSQREAYEAMLGSHFGEKKSRKKRPINLTAQLRMGLEPYLAFQFPRAAVRALISELDFEAELHKLDVEAIADDLRLGDILGDCAIDALMGPMGIVRLGHRVSHEAIDIDGEPVPLTYPFVSWISLDDYFCDPEARTDGEKLFEGHINRFLRSAVVDQLVFGRDPDELDPRIPPNMVMTREEAARFMEGMEPIGTHERNTVAGITTSNTTDIEKPLQKVAVRDMVIQTADGPFLAVMPAAGDGDNARDVPDKYLLLEPYEAARKTPFEFLRYHRLPGSILAHPPETVQRDLAEATDAIAQKVISRLLKQKAVNVYEPGSEDDALQIKSAADEEWKQVSNANGVKRIEQGGVPKELYEALGWLGAVWNDASGQVRMVQGSQDTGTDTATEYSGETSRVNTGLAFKQGRIQTFASRIYSHLGWWSCANPMQERTIRYQLPNGADINVPFSQAAGTKTGDYWQFAFECEAYTMQVHDPAVRLRRVLEGLDRLLGYFPIAMQSGGAVRLDEIAKLLRRELNAPEFERIGPTQQAMGEMARMQLLQARGASQPGPIGVSMSGGGMGGTGGMSKTRGMGNGGQGDAGRSATNGVSPA